MWRNEDVGRSDSMKANSKVLAHRGAAGEHPRPSRDDRVPPTWLVAVVATLGVLSSLAAAGFSAKAPGVYWSRVQIWFVAPGSTNNPNALRATSSSLIATAGAVGKMVDSRRLSANFGSGSVTLSDEGQRHGSSVALPNTGSQWVAGYGAPWLDVQAVDSDPATVASTMGRLVDQINSSLFALQQRQNAPAKSLIRTQMSPGAIPIYYRRGSSIRAAAASLVLGLILTHALVRRLRRPRRHVRTAAGCASTSDEADSTGAMQMPALTT